MRLTLERPYPAIRSILLPVSVLRVLQTTKMVLGSGPSILAMVLHYMHKLRRLNQGWAAFKHITMDLATRLLPFPGLKT